jgi:predicted porin
MPKTKKSDLQVLRALLALPDGKLGASEKRAFQHMYDNVATGQVIQLSKKQRLWVDGAYDKLDLDNPNTAPAAKPVAVKDKQLLKPVKAS